MEELEREGQGLSAQINGAPSARSWGIAAARDFSLRCWTGSTRSMGLWRSLW